MAKAFESPDGDGWRASYRKLFARGNQLAGARIPERFLKPGKEAESAQVYAEVCEGVCRLLEISPDDATIDFARSINAITARQANGLRGHKPAESEALLKGALTIQHAADNHPSTIREEQRDLTAYLRHAAELKEFLAFAKINALRDLRMEHVVAYVADMKRRGLSFDSRRHRLLYIRRATWMGATLGVPDVLGGFGRSSGLRLDFKDTVSEPDTWSMETILGRLFWLGKGRKFLAAVALGALMGLSPSETYRLRAEDFQGRTLFVGKRESKNRYRRRPLPMPAIVQETLAPFLKAKAPGDLLFPRPRGGSYNATSWSAFMGKHIRAWMPPLRDARTESPLRKAFATWATNFLDLKDMDRYMGRRISGMDATTALRYFSNKFNADDLARAADLIDEKAREIIARARKRFVGRAKKMVRPNQLAFIRIPTVISLAPTAGMIGPSSPASSAPHRSEG